ncbi:Phosphatidate phosphatase PAH1 [Hibiscus syriacus]|uniref:Phosphatidate phosphatase PAH1 n=1 Tax=Hibiscus syriacus TaxID=106335 RepID=A0A6A3BQC7_HIBSY|nr:phosphatidate phosphatase PAH1-like [Hibiscus syriacus]KAE8717292.1 Phosphatidate phosphatase PAH1 [Hibiscus syriacus]
MNVVGRVGSLISQGVYSVATPFHPFGGAIDVIVVQQKDGTFRSTPWYVRFGKFQGVLKGAEKVVGITVNGVEADFHMCLDNSGEAYFVREVDAGYGFYTNGGMNDSGCQVTQDDGDKHSAQVCRLEHSVSESRVAVLRDELEAISPKRFERTESDTRFYEFQDEQSTLEDSVAPGQCKDLEGNCHGEAQDVDSEVLLFSVDGHVLAAPSSESEQNAEDMQLSTPRFHIGPDEGPECFDGNEEIISGYNVCATDCTNKLSSVVDKGSSHDICGAADSDSTALRRRSEFSQDGCRSEETSDYPNSQSEFNRPSDVGDESLIIKRGEVYKSCLELSELSRHSENSDPGDTDRPLKDYISQDKLSCILSDFDENKHGAVDGSKIEDVSSSSNDNGPIGNESQRSVERFGASVSTEGINSSRQSLEPENNNRKSENVKTEHTSGKETGDYSNPGMGLEVVVPAVLEAHHIPNKENKSNASSVIMNASGSQSIVEPQNRVPVERVEPSNPKGDGSTVTSTASTRRWKLWPIPFMKGKNVENTDVNSSNGQAFVDTKPDLQNSQAGSTLDSSRKQFIRTNVPTTEQIASLNLKDGQNMVIFNFSTRVFGNQQVDAHLYLWKWNDKIVISDVDGTITKSDVLGQFMPLVGRDWTQSGVAKLFSAIKENGYQLLFLSARAIVQAYITRNFLLNLKQDGKALPSGPVVISPDGLFPSLYREVIRRAPHEFKIACLEDIKKLFPSDHNPFYAGFGNRDTDELSYLKIGIPKGKIFIINPKGEVAISHCVNNARSYTSLHTLVDDMFPPASLVEQEDYNQWNFWKVPLPDI